MTKSIATIVTPIVIAAFFGGLTIGRMQGENQGEIYGKQQGRVEVAQEIMELSHTYLNAAGRPETPLAIGQEFTTFSIDAYKISEVVGTANSRERMDKIGELNNYLVNRAERDSTK